MRIIKVVLEFKERILFEIKFNSTEFLIIGDIIGDASNNPKAESATQKSSPPQRRKKNFSFISWCLMQHFPSPFQFFMDFISFALNSTASNATGISKTQIISLHKIMG